MFKKSSLIHISKLELMISLPVTLDTRSTAAFKLQLTSSSLILLSKRHYIVLCFKVNSN